MLVRIAGLTRDVTLNGKLAIRDASRDAQGRCAVKVPGGDWILVKEENVKTVGHVALMENTMSTRLIFAAPGVRIVDDVLVTEKPIAKRDRVLVEIVQYGTPQTMHETIVLDTALFDALAPYDAADTPEEQIIFASQKLLRNGFCVGEHEHCFVGPNMSRVDMSTKPNCTFDVMTSPSAPVSFAVLIARRDIDAGESISVFRSHLSPDGVDADINFNDEVALLRWHELDPRLHEAFGVPHTDFQSATLAYLRKAHANGVVLPRDVVRIACGSKRPTNTGNALW